MAIAILLVLAVLCSFFYLFLVYPMTEKPSKYYFTVDAGSQLSEGNAVELSKQALIKYGEELNRIRPAPFSHAGQGVYAANSVKPNSGYVLWSVNSSRRKWDYKVQITKTGSEVICEITKPK